MASSMHEALVPCFSYRIVPSWDTAALAGATLLWTTCLMQSSGALELQCT